MPTDIEHVFACLCSKYLPLFQVLALIDEIGCKHSIVYEKNMFNKETFVIIINYYLWEDHIWLIAAIGNKLIMVQSRNFSFLGCPKLRVQFLFLDSQPNLMILVEFQKYEIILIIAIITV